MPGFSKGAVSSLALSGKRSKRLALSNVSVSYADRRRTRFLLPFDLPKAESTLAAGQTRIKDLTVRPVVVYHSPPLYTHSDSNIARPTPDDAHGNQYYLERTWQYLFRWRLLSSSSSIHRNHLGRLGFFS
jgi:hypothetical protein